MHHLVWIYACYVKAFEPFCEAEFSSPHLIFIQSKGPGCAPPSPCIKRLSEWNKCMNSIACTISGSLHFVPSESFPKMVMTSWWQSLEMLCWPSLSLTLSVSANVFFLMLFKNNLFSKNKWKPLPVDKCALQRKLLKLIHSHSWHC